MYFSGSVAVPSRHSSNSSMARDVAVPSSSRSESMLPYDLAAAHGLSLAHQRLRQIAVYRRVAVGMLHRHLAAARLAAYADDRSVLYGGHRLLIFQTEDRHAVFAVRRVETPAEAACKRRREDSRFGAYALRAQGSIRRARPPWPGAAASRHAWAVCATCRSGSYRSSQSSGAWAYCCS